MCIRDRISADWLLTFCCRGRPSALPAAPPVKALSSSSLRRSLVAIISLCNCSDTWSCRSGHTIKRPRVSAVPRYRNSSQVVRRHRRGRGCGRGSATRPSGRGAPRTP
eukprot:917338-Pyramimonas_sp.AAC.1